MPKYKVIGQGQGWTVIQADVLDYLAGSLWLRQYYSEFFHFLLCDWPYNLESQVKRFGGQNSKPAQFGRDGAFARQSRGFMGQTWDGTTLAYEPETWTAILAHLYPGAFTAGFSHPRKQHRLAAAQEEAGYVMNPALYQIGWVYASGKPNGTRIDTQIDRRAGAEREVVGQVKRWGHNAGYGSGSFYANGYQATTGKVKLDDITVPATPLAQAWAGHQYGSPLAPELEPIIIAQAPWQKNRLDTILATGAGAVNIEAGKQGMPERGHPGHFIITHHPECSYRGVKRIKNGSGSVTGEEPSSQAYGKTLHTYAGRFEPKPYQAKGDSDGYITVPDYDCHPDCPARRLDEQAGEKSFHFYQADWTYEIQERLAGINPVYYQGKVTALERNAGCGELPLKERRRVNPGGLEREKRFANTWQYNDHPTLKSIKLCKWIAGLFLPPEQYRPRRVFVPTCGTGSEMIGCLLAGWDEVIGVELNPGYAEVACRRLAWWSEWLRWGQRDPDAILAAAGDKQVARQLEAGQLKF